MAIETGTFWVRIETTGAIFSFDMSKVALLDLMQFIAKHCKSKILTVKASSDCATSVGYLQFIRAISKLKQFLEGYERLETYEHEYIDDLEDFEICDGVHPDHIWDRTWNLFC
jgi:hypothetical protein